MGRGGNTVSPAVKANSFKWGLGMCRRTREGRVDRQECRVPMTASFLWARLSLVEDEQR